MLAGQNTLLAQTGRRHLDRSRRAELNVPERLGSPQGNEIIGMRTCGCRRSHSDWLGDQSVLVDQTENGVMPSWLPSHFHLIALGFQIETQALGQMLLEGLRFNLEAEGYQ